MALQLTQSLTNKRTAFECAGYCEDGRLYNDADEYYDDDYFADEQIANGSAEVGELKRGIICSLLWYKKLLRTNLTDVQEDAPRI